MYLIEPYSNSQNVNIINRVMSHVLYFVKGFACCIFVVRPPTACVSNYRCFLLCIGSLAITSFDLCQFAKIFE